MTPLPPLEGDATADVVIVGGGYLGLWTAWQLRELEPELDVVVLEAALCGHGPSGRNGGFCETLWPDAAILRERAGDAAALAVCRASEDAVRGIGAWCSANGVDAWFREAPMLRVATTESQLGSWDDVVRAAAELGAPDEVTAASADEVERKMRVAALPRRRAVPPERDRAAGPPRSRPAGETPRAGSPNSRADRGHPAAPRWRRRHAARSRPCPRDGARRQLRGSRAFPAIGSRSQWRRATSS